jgi:hypothetical protein
MRACSTLLSCAVSAYVLTAAGSASGYELRTHAAISQQAFDLSSGVLSYTRDVGINLLERFDPGGTAAGATAFVPFDNHGTARDWLAVGAIREDDYRTHVPGCKPPRNPLDKGETIDRPKNHFFDVQRAGAGLMSVAGLPAPDWALGLQGQGPNPDQNHFSLPDARVYQLRSLAVNTREERDRNTALLFRTLGQVIHVLQDMAQPQHTRNDPHLGCTLLEFVAGETSWYEMYTETRASKERYRSRSDASRPLVLSGYDPVSFQSYRDYWANPAGSGLAEVSSRNFFSAGTNLGAFLGGPCGGLSRPVCNPDAYAFEDVEVPVFPLSGASTTGQVRFFLLDITDPVTGQVERGVRVSTRSLWDQHLEEHGQRPKFSLNTYNYDSIADILLPRAAGYSAGLLDHFFRGRLDVALVPAPDDDTRTRFLLRGTNASIEPLVDGAIWLYADDAGGARSQVASFTPIAVTPDQPVGAGDPIESAPFVPPPGAVRYVAIYHGALGQEQGAVIGKVLGPDKLEELYIAGNGGVDDVWFRNAGNNVALGVGRDTHLGGQRPLGVIWGADGLRFAVWIAGWEYHVFRLNRTQDAPYAAGADIGATWERSEQPFDSAKVAIDVSVTSTTTGTQSWAIATPAGFEGDRCDTVFYRVTPASRNLGGTMSKRRAYTMRDLFYTPFPSWVGAKMDQETGGWLIKDISDADGTDSIDVAIRDAWLDEDGELAFALTLFPDMTFGQEQYRGPSTVSCEPDSGLTIHTPPLAVGEHVSIAEPMGGIWSSKAGWLWRSFRLPAVFNYRDDVSQPYIENASRSISAYLWTSGGPALTCTYATETQTITRIVSPVCGTLTERQLGGRTQQVTVEGENTWVTEVSPVDAYRVYPDPDASPGRTYIDMLAVPGIGPSETGDVSTDWVDLFGGHMQDPSMLGFVDAALQLEGGDAGAVWQTQHVRFDDPPAVGGISIDWFSTHRWPSRDQDQAFAILVPSGPHTHHIRLINRVGLRDVRLIHWDGNPQNARYMVAVWLDPGGNVGVPVGPSVGVFVVDGSGQLVTVLSPFTSGSPLPEVNTLPWMERAPKLLSASDRHVLWLRTYRRNREDFTGRTELVLSQLPNGAERVVASSYLDVATLASALDHELTVLEPDRLYAFGEEAFAVGWDGDGTPTLDASDPRFPALDDSVPPEARALRAVDRITDLTVTDDGPAGSGWLHLAYTWYAVVAEDANGALHPSSLAAGYTVVPGYVSRTLRWTNPSPPPVRVHVFRWSESEEGAYVARLEGPVTEWVESSTASPEVTAFQPGPRRPARRLVNDPTLLPAR